MGRHCKPAIGLYIARTYGHLCAQPEETHLYNRDTSSHFPQLLPHFFLRPPFWIIRRVTALHSFPDSRSRFPVLRSPFPVPRSPFPVLRSPFPVLRFPFSGISNIQYTLAEKCFSRNEMYIPPMSDSSLWLLSKALDFWEIIILKSAPTLHLIYYATFETFFFKFASAVFRCLSNDIRRSFKHRAAIV